MNNGRASTDSCEVLLDRWWSSSLGCSIEDFHSEIHHVVDGPEAPDSWPKPFPMTKRCVSLVTTGKGWVLSVPADVREEAERECHGLSFEDMTREGDEALEKWYLNRASGGVERPGVMAYPALGRLARDLDVRGWAHYVHWFVNERTWRPGRLDSHVRLLSQEDSLIWQQWLALPGDFCKPSFSEYFDVSDAFAYVLNGRIVSVAQIEGNREMLAWEFGVDTLADFRGKGYATETGRATVVRIIECGKIPWYYYAHYNRASGRIPQKLGFFRYLEGVFSHPQRSRA